MWFHSGGPGSGKSTLLKYIANTHYTDKKHKLGGELKIGSLSPGKGVYWTKLVAYIDQIDRLHALLTVFETCNFAWKCRSGGTHRRAHYSEDDEADETIEMMNEMGFTVNSILQLMGLERVRDTFVGDQVSVRGVSGGEKKRVTCSEMFCVGVPVLCCDEMSTGLDGTGGPFFLKVIFDSLSYHCFIHFCSCDDVRNHTIDRKLHPHDPYHQDSFLVAATSGDGCQL